MNFYIKQKVFSWGDTFFIYDEAGNERYHVKGPAFSFGKKLHVYDNNGQEVAYIHQKVFSFLPTFCIYKGETQIAEIKKRLTFAKDKYNISGLDWDVRGDFFDHNYTVINGYFPIATVTKKWFSWGDTYQISISDDADEVSALAVVLVIDACIDAQRNN